MPQTVIAHARDLATGDTILPHSHAKAQLIYANSGVMVVTTDTGAFFVPPQYAVWMPAGIVHRINTRGPLAMRTLYVRSDAAPDLPAEVCVRKFLNCCGNSCFQLLSLPTATQRGALKSV